MDFLAGLLLFFKGGGVVSAFKSYLLSVTAASFVLEIVAALLPGMQSKKPGLLIGTLIMILVVLSPLVRLSPEQIARSIAELRLETEELRTGIELETKELQGSIIKEQTEAYVLDKAKAMEVDITIEITLRENQGVPYPYCICLTGSVTEKQQQILGQIIETDLGIPLQRQTWKEA